MGRFFLGIGGLMFLLFGFGIMTDFVVLNHNIENIQKLDLLVFLFLLVGILMLYQTAAIDKRVDKK